MNHKQVIEPMTPMDELNPVGAHGCAPDHCAPNHNHSPNNGNVPNDHIPDSLKPYPTMNHRLSNHHVFAQTGRTAVRPYIWNLFGAGGFK